MLREAILRGWEWARDNLPAEILAGNLGESEESGSTLPFRHVGGCGFSLGTFGAGQVSMTAHVEVRNRPGITSRCCFAYNIKPSIRTAGFARATWASIRWKSNG